MRARTLGMAGAVGKVIVGGSLALIGLGHAAPAHALYNDACNGDSTVLVIGCTYGAEVDGVELELPVCRHEDGNPNGLPCLWQDRPTGRVYYVDSANYRR